MQRSSGWAEGRMLRRHPAPQAEERRPDDGGSPLIAMELASRSGCRGPGKSGTRLRRQFRSADLERRGWQARFYPRPSGRPAPCISIWPWNAKTRALFENAGRAKLRRLDQIRLLAPYPEFWRRSRLTCGRETLYREVPEQHVELLRWLSSERRQSLWNVVCTCDRRP